MARSKLNRHKHTKHAIATKKSHEQKHLQSFIGGIINDIMDNTISVIDNNLKNHENQNVIGNVDDVE